MVMAIFGKAKKPKVSFFKVCYPKIYSFFRNRLDPDTEFGLFLTVGTLVSFILLLVFLELLRDVIYQETSRADFWILAIVDFFRSASLNKIMLFFTYFGRWEIIMFGTFFVSVILYLQDKKRYLFTLLFSVFFGQIIVLLLKDLIDRPRPDIIPAITIENTFSFPSGHVFIVMAFFGLIAFYLFRYFKEYWKKALVTVFAVLLVAIVSISRIYLGLHWPTDVLASLAAGGAWLSVMITSLEIRDKREPERSEPKLERQYIESIGIGLFVVWIFLILCFVFTTK
jgi:membrane-associated phospholipid phosphatase